MILQDDGMVSAEKGCFYGHWGPDLRYCSTLHEFRTLAIRDFLWLRGCTTFGSQWSETDADLLFETSTFLLTQLGLECSTPLFFPVWFTEIPVYLYNLQPLIWGLDWLSPLSVKAFANDWKAASTDGGNHGRWVCHRDWLLVDDTDR